MINDFGKPYREIFLAEQTRSKQDRNLKRLLGFAALYLAGHFVWFLVR